MSMPSSAVATWLVIAGLSTLVAGSPQQETALPLHVSHRSGPLFPGDVVWVAVSAPPAATAVAGTAFGRGVRFWPAESAGEWQALVPIGLETTPGAYELAIQASGAGGAPATQSLRLDVRAKAFETRQLRVAPQFVEPPPAEAQRIEREARAVAAVYARTDTGRLWQGSFVMPVPGRPTSSFGRLSVFNGQPRGRHQGADFAAAIGTPVRAPNAGRVVLAMDLFLAGNTIILDHGAGLFSVFAHLSRMTVDVGTRAAQGDLLGEAGATGRVTGPHLHWAVRLGELSVDPLSLMSAAEALSASADTRSRP
jgi:murein DD-endopeptidase MepM/ murein hydrolase activator NlpD